jgi:hypothetical protein
VVAHTDLIVKSVSQIQEFAQAVTEKPGAAYRKVLNWFNQATVEHKEPRITMALSIR